MNYYISNGTFYIVSPHTSGGELHHAGVKGMKWGRRKAIPFSNTIARTRRKQSSSPEQVARNEERKKKAIKAAKIGAAVAATALVAF